MEKEIINRVASSGLITFNLEDYYQPGERVIIDLRDQLFQGLILREKEFREFVKAHPWNQYTGKFVAITCSADAIIPVWAYMLIAASIRPFAKLFYFGSVGRMEEKIYEEVLARIDWEEFRGKKVVIKGCSKVEVPDSIYLEAVRYLQPVVASLMFGEPCSTVPIFKTPKLPPVST